MKIIKLGVNIDHVATVRQARRGKEPSVVEAALAAVAGGADGITVHLREDRRHIQELDVRHLKTDLPVPLNLEMAATEEIVKIAEQVRPAWVCLVPEKRQELTTEGGLNIASEADQIKRTIARLKKAGIRVSLFIEPVFDSVRQAADVGADAIELHTGVYARLFEEKQPKLDDELRRICLVAQEAESRQLLVNAGHGLTYENVRELARRFPFNEFNIGFSIISKALFVGMKDAVQQMKESMQRALCVAS